MKPIFLLAGSFLFSFFASAQSAPPTPENLMPLGTVSNLLAPFNQVEAKYIGQNGLGKIYAMPQDNMPCLVPTTSLENSMPVYVPPFNSDVMPNPIPLQHLFNAPVTNSTNSNFSTIKKVPAPASKNLMLDLIRKK